MCLACPPLCSIHAILETLPVLSKQSSLSYLTPRFLYSRLRDSPGGRVFPLSSPLSRRSVSYTPPLPRGAQALAEPAYVSDPLFIETRRGACIRRMVEELRSEAVPGAPNPNPKGWKEDAGWRLRLEGGRVGKFPRAVYRSRDSRR